jgi:hypothetical protein
MGSFMFLAGFSVMLGAHVYQYTLIKADYTDTNQC